MNSRLPTRKVTAGMLGGALSIIAIYALELVSGVTVPSAVAQSLTVVLTFLVSYLVPEPNGDTVVVPTRRGPGGPVLAVLVAALAWGGAADASPARAVLVSRDVVVETPEIDDVTGEVTGYVWETIEQVPELWIDLSVSLDVAVINLRSKEYQIGVSPGVGYGLRYSPAWWTLSEAVLALDVFVAAGVVATEGSGGRPTFFAIDALPAIVFGNWVSIGVGPRFRISLREGVEGGVDPVLTFGVSKSL